MNILYAILLIIAILIAFLLFLALVIKKEYSIERDVLINRSANTVFSYIKLVRNQEQYNVWVMKDPNVKIIYNGIDGTEGFISAWEGNKQAGKGEQEIKRLIDGESMELAIRFEKPFKNEAKTFMYTKISGTDQTKVTWKMEGRNTYPMNLMNIIIDGLLGKDLEKSLINLKTNLESKS